MRDCDQALVLRPGDPDSRNGRAFILYRQKAFKEAVVAYDALLSDKPNYAPALFMRGVVKLTLGDEGGGDADLKAAREKAASIDLLHICYGIKIK